MKLNAQQSMHRSGMSLLELTVVILVMISLITILFLGASAWKKGSDRAVNIMNIRNCQQAMRSEQNMRLLNPGAAFTQSHLEVYMEYPTRVNGTIGDYTNTAVITPYSSNPADSWAHMWLIPGNEGLPGGNYGHTEVADVSGW